MVSNMKKLITLIPVFGNFFVKPLGLTGWRSKHSAIYFIWHCASTAVIALTILAQS
jgi:hypothetical protein